MTVSDIARETVVTATPDQSAGNLATLMKEEGVGSVVIVDGREPVGIVTDRDLTVSVLEPRADPTATTAGDVMTETPVTVTADTGVFETVRRMEEAAVRRMPVVDGDGRLAGIVTLDDVLVLLSDEMGTVTGVIEAESPPY